ncbi:MAG: hypothetical protein GVX78_02515 [Bacteroidetes bacterium]|jgi:hypothetical protein|nr:hypothetical protein [Bacteroidota bacterium]
MEPTQIYWTSNSRVSDKSESELITHFLKAYKNARFNNDGPWERKYDLEMNFRFYPSCFETITKHKYVWNGKSLLTNVNDEEAMEEAPSDNYSLIGIRYDLMFKLYNSKPRLKTEQNEKKETLLQIILDIKRILNREIVMSNLGDENYFGAKIWLIAKSEGNPILINHRKTFTNEGEYTLHNK